MDIGNCDLTTVSFRQHQLLVFFSPTVLMKSFNLWNQSLQCGQPFSKSRMLGLSVFSHFNSLSTTISSSKSSRDHRPLVLRSPRAVPRRVLEAPRRRRRRQGTGWRNKVHANRSRTAWADGASYGGAQQLDWLLDERRVWWWRIGEGYWRNCKYLHLLFLIIFIYLGLSYFATMSAPSLCYMFTSSKFQVYIVSTRITGDGLRRRDCNDYVPISARLAGELYDRTKKCPCL